MKNVVIHALGLAETMLVVKLSIIFQFAHAMINILVIHSQAVIQSLLHVRFKKTVFNYQYIYKSSFTTSTRTST
jgi:hypothetical protein